MKSSRNTTLLVIIFFCFIGICKPSANCFGAPGKCDGYIHCTEGTLVNHTSPINTFYDISKEKCEENCIDGANSTRSIYFRNNKTCQLFPNGVVVVKISITTVCFWTCCKLNKVCKRTTGMCRGYWVQYERQKLVDTWDLSRYTGIEPDDCKNYCQKNPVCVSVNYELGVNYSNNVCQLFKFGPPDSHLEQSINSSAFKWKCCPDDDTDIPNKCQTGAGKCIGRWRKSSEKPRQDMRWVNDFYSRNKFGCLKACRHNPYCHVAYYSQTRYLCKLKSNASKTKQDFPCSGYVHYSWKAYDWQCCNNKQNAIKTANEMLMNSRKCMCFNSSIWVAANNCDRPDLQQRMVLNSKHTALWILNELSLDGWTPYYNGYMKIWVKRSGKYDSRLCESIHCDIFSTPIKRICPHVISRANWFANAQKPGLLPFQTTPRYVNIMDLGETCPVLGCYTKESCSSNIRMYQYYQQEKLGYSDLMYSFVVGSDGSLFEVRGTKFRTGDTLDYKTVTIIIAFTGYYQYQMPTVASLRAVKQLVLCLQRSGNITVNFKLSPDSDMSSLPDNPGILLKNLLQNWPHYESIPFNEIPCPPKPILWHLILPEGAVFLMFCLILTMIVIRYRRVWRHTIWCPVRNQRSSRNAIRLCELGNHGLLLAHMKDVPSNCLIRDCQTWRLSISTLPLVILQTDLDCLCARQLQQLWFQCSIRAWDNFPKRAAALLTSRRCPATTVLGMGISQPFVLHGRQTQRLLSLIGEITTRRCVCRGQKKVHGVYAYLSGVEDITIKMASSGWSEKWSGWMQEAEVDPRQLQHVFLRRGGGMVEVTYQQFLLHPELLSTSQERIDDLAQLVDNYG